MLARSSIATVLILLFLASQSRAIELGLNLYGVCKHLNAKKMIYQPMLNETNPGLGMTMNIIHEKYAIFLLEGGFFEDSFKNTARYFSVGYKFPICRYVSAGFHLAQYSSKSISESVIGLFPIVSLRYRALAVHGIYLPKYKNINPYHIIAAYLTLYVIDRSGK